jgi:hypothetical protein
MSSTVTASTEINLSSETINNMVLEVVDIAQFLGLPLNKAMANLSENYAEIRRLVDLYSNLGSYSIPSPDQCWQ